MGYCILRFAKLKSRVSLLRATEHNARDRPPSNADPDRTKYNQSVASAEAMRRFDAHKPDKVRKNAVLAVEVMLTLSPDSWPNLPPKERSQQSQKFLVAARDWATKTLGGDENVLQVSYHRDERTPHVHLLMIPMHEGKLNARHFIGGHRDRLKELQTEFAKEVGAKFGLERGLPREETGRRHITVGRFYALGQDAVKKEIERQHALAARPNRLKKDDLGL